MFAGFACESGEELRRQLAATDIAVPGRAAGRRTWHCERWSICRWLATMLAQDQLHFPLSLMTGDRPDFVLKQGDSAMGIEVTEAVPENYARFLALSEREFPTARWENAHFRPVDPRRSAADLRAIPNERSAGWDGDVCERDWAEWMVMTVSRKRERLNHPEFDRFPDNALLIYDNTPVPKLLLKHRQAHGFLIPKLADAKTAADFSRIYIETGATMIAIVGDSTNLMTLNDLWRGVDAD